MCFGWWIGSQLKLGFSLARTLIFDTARRLFSPKNECLLRLQHPPEGVACGRFKMYIEEYPKTYAIEMRAYNYPKTVVFMNLIFLLYE